MVSAGEDEDTAARPGEDWRPLANQIARNAQDYLDGMAALAGGEGGEETVPLMLLEVAQIMLAGAKLGASKDVILPGNWEPDVGADPDLTCFAPAWLPGCSTATSTRSSLTPTRTPGPRRSGYRMILPPWRLTLSMD